MQFSISLGNHNLTGADTLQDVLDNIAYQLTDLGHDVVRKDERLSTDRINILFEAFDRGYEKRLEAARAAGARIVIVCTERPGKPGFNDSANPMLVERQKAFPLCAPHAEAVWCLVPGVDAWARQFNPQSCYLELGHSPSREKALRCGDSTFFDFAFYGSVTPRRKAILHELERRGHPARFYDETIKLPDVAARNALVASCAVVLGINPWPKWKLISNSRLSTALHLGRPVIMEPVEDVGPWGEVVTVAKAHGSFVDEAIDMLPKWRAARDAQVERFRRLMPPEACVGKAIEETLQCK